MPVTIQPTTLRYKDENGVFQTVDCLKGEGFDLNNRVNSLHGLVPYGYEQDAQISHDGLSYYRDGTTLLINGEGTASSVSSKIKLNGAMQHGDTTA